MSALLLAARNPEVDPTEDFTVPASPPPEDPLEATADLRAEAAAPETGRLVAPVPQPVVESAPASERLTAAERSGVEDLHRAVLMQVPVAIVIVEPRTRTIVLANEAVAATIADSDRPWTGRSFPELFPKELEASSMAVIAEAVERRNASSTLAIRHAEGSLRAIEAKAALVRWGRGRAVLVTLRDVADRRHLEDEVSRLQAENAALLQALQGFLLRVDGQGSILDYRASDDGERGVPASVLFGSSLEDVLEADALERCRAALAIATDCGRVQHIELAGPTDEGDRTFEGSVVPLQGGEAAIVLRNVSGERSLKENVQRLRSRLASVEERFGGLLFAELMHERPAREAATEGASELVLGSRAAAGG